MKQILNTLIEIRLRKLFKVFSKFSRQMFRDIIDEKMKIMFKKRKTIAQMKIVKEKEMHVESIKLNSIESVHLRKIIVQIIFLCLIYVVVYLTMNVFINDVKIKILFDNDVEINCMSKKLIDITQLFIR